MLTVTNEINYVTVISHSFVLNNINIENVTYFKNAGVTFLDVDLYKIYSKLSQKENHWSNLRNIE